jgi:hypothetical protein
VVAGGLGQHRRRLPRRLFLSAPELGQGRLALDGDLLPGVGDLPLDRAAQLLGVQVRLLANGLHIVLGLAAQRLGLSPTRLQQGLGLGLGPVEVGGSVGLEPGPDLVDLGQPARLELVALAGGLVAGRVRLAASLRAQVLGVVGGPVQDLARLLLGEPEDLGGTTTEVGVVDVVVVAALLQLTPEVADLALEAGGLLADLDHGRLEGPDVVVHRCPVVAAQGRREVPRGTGGIIEESESGVVR